MDAARQKEKYGKWQEVPCWPGADTVAEIVIKSCQDQPLLSQREMRMGAKEK